MRLSRVCVSRLAPRAVRDSRTAGGFNRRVDCRAGNHLLAELYAVHRLHGAPSRADGDERQLNRAP